MNLYYLPTLFSLLRKVIIYVIMIKYTSANSFYFTQKFKVQLQFNE